MFMVEAPVLESLILNGYPLQLIQTSIYIIRTFLWYPTVKSKYLQTLHINLVDTNSGEQISHFDHVIETRLF
jgi:hypothetical protein